jgi:hypothetical protein
MYGFHGRRRARLLVGVAAAAVAATGAGKAVGQEAKWQPWLEAGGMIGTNHSFGDVDIFIPVWQDQTSLLFGDLRGKFSNEPTQEGNFGLGYRTQIDPEWILGGYGYFDIQNSENDNLFYQATLGLEALSVDWDFRLNGYIPINAGGESIDSHKGNLQINGNTIGITHDQEKPLYGFDGEVGWRLPIFPADGDVDVRAFIGGYYFANSDVDTVAGPRGRLEVRLYDIDILGVQSRLTVDGEIQWDNPRGTQAFGGLELRIPLGVVTGTPGPKLSPLDRRMVDRVQRDVDIVTRKYQSDPKDVVVDELTVKTHTIVFAQEGAPDDASGTKNDPISLNAAVARAQSLGKNAIIVVEGGSSGIVVDQPLQLASGQALLGGGSKVPLTDGGGHSVNFHVPGQRPTLVGTSTGLDLIDMAPGSQNEVFGLDLTGQMFNGIYGLNMQRAIVKQVNIDPPVANGIYIKQDSTLSPGAQASSFVHLESNSVVSAGGNGILVTNLLEDGAGHSQTVIIDHNTASYNFENGIVVANLVSGSGTSLSQAAEIFGNVANGNGSLGMVPTLQPLLDAEGGIGIAVANLAISSGAIAQDLAITDNTVSFNYGFNRLVAPPAPISGALVLPGAGTGTGIVVENAGVAGGSVSQNAAIVGNTATYNSHVGIAVINDAVSGGAIEQSLAIYGNFVSANGTGNLTAALVPIGAVDGVGIGVGNFAYSQGVISQTLQVAHNTVAGNRAEGIAIGNFVTYNAAVLQSGSVSDNLVSSNDGIGILVVNQGGRAGTSGATVGQVLAITGNSVDHNRYGIGGLNSFYGGAILGQSLTIEGNSVVLNSGDGIALYSRFSGGASGSQVLVISGNTINQNGEDGVFVGAYLSGASLGQDVTMLSNVVAQNDRYGVAVFARGRSATLSQNVSIAGNSILDSAADGIHIYGGFSSDSTVSQVATITGNTIDASGDDGIQIRLHGLSGTTVAQSVAISGNSIIDSTGYGIQVAAYASIGTALTQSVSVGGNLIQRTISADGVEVGAVAYNSSTLTQSVAITGNSIGDVNGDGIDVFTVVDGGAFGSASATESLSIAGNDIRDASRNGVHVFSYASFAALTQTLLTISGNTIADPGINGIALENRVRSGGVLLQGSLSAPAAITDNVVSSASRSGIVVYNSASSGTLSQALVIGTNTVTEASVGVLMMTRAYGSATLSQAVAVSGNVLNNVSDGIVVRNSVSNGAAAIQDVTISGNVIDALGRVADLGINVYNVVINSGTLTQGVSIQGNTIATAGSGARAGIALFNSAAASGGIGQSAVVTGNSIASGFTAGIGLEDVAATGGSIGQTLDISANEIGAARYAGIGMLVRVRDGATVVQSGTVSANLVAGETGAGGGGGLVSFLYTDTGGGATQALTLTANSFTNNAANGLYLKAFATSSGGPALQTLSLSANVIDGNGNDGVHALASGGSATQTVTFVNGSNNSITNNVGVGVYGSNAAGASQAISLGNSVITGNGTPTGGNAVFSNP